jgi:hypothetical protein
MKNKRPDQADTKQKLRVLFDSGCGATLINKRFVDTGRRLKVNLLSGLPKVVASKQKENVKLNSPYQHSMRIGRSHAVPM